jgi:sulfur-carrier protein
MATIWIPAPMRVLTDGKDSVHVPGRTVGQALRNLETIHPGTWDRLCQEDDLRPFITVVVDGEMSEMRMHQPLQENSEVHFLPAMEGG